MGPTMGIRGLGRHECELTLENLVLGLRYACAGTILYVIAVCIPKHSGVFFYIRVLHAEFESLPDQCLDRPRPCHGTDSLWHPIIHLPVLPYEESAATNFIGTLHQ